MPKVSIRGVSRCYEWFKEPENSDKPVMVFIHGWGGSSQYWRSTAEQLTENFNCLIYDLKGFGGSFLTDKYKGKFDLAGYVLELSELLDTLKIGGDIVLNAHSMGASIAALFTAQYPEKVRQLILNCNGVFEYDERAFSIFQKIGKGIVQFRYPWFKNIPLMDQVAISRFLYRPIKKADRQQFLEDFLIADNRAAVGTLVGAVNKEMVVRISEAFRQIQCPTLFLSGEKDKIIPAAMAKKAIALNPKLQYVEIPQVGHFPMLESPDIYQQEIRKFLQI